MGISQSVCVGSTKNLVPEEIRQMLLEHHREQVFSTLRMTAELFRLLELFTAKEIPALIVKGPALAMQAYGDPTMRSYGDLDFLVRQRDIRRATESLLAAGYEAAVPLSAIDAGKIPGQYFFFKTDTKLVVELHNDFTLRYFPRPLPIEEFFARQIRVCIDGHEAPALSVEDELVLICIHGAKHLWERLMWIADVAALVSRQTGIDWGRATASARAVRADHHAAHGVAPRCRLASRTSARSHCRARAAGCPGCEACRANSPLAACCGSCASGSVRTRGVSPAYARWSTRCTCLSSATLVFLPRKKTGRSDGEISHNRFLDTLRRPFRLARKYGRGAKS